MSGLMDILSQTLGGDTTAQIGRQIGADPAATSSAIAMALPMLLSGLNRNASEPAGATALHSALGAHDGNILNDLGGFLGNAQGGPGAGILRHVLGDRQDHASQAIGRASGLSATQVTQLLVVIAPLVMGALGRMQRQGGLDAGGVSSMLGNEHGQQAQAAPDLMGMATRLLDRNNDGSMLDDVMRGLGGILGKR